MSSSRIVARDARGNDIRHLLEYMLESLDVGNNVKGKSVVLKPNLCTERPEIINIANTSIEVLCATVEYLLQFTNNIVIGESDGMRYSVNQAFENNGIYHLVKKYGIRAVSFTDDLQVEVPYQEFRGWPFSRTWVESDVFITLPKIKTHATSYFTGALKNQWGCVSRRDRILLHKNLDRLIGLVNRVRRPDFIVMDGILGMEGRGPINGEPLPLDVLLVGNDPVAMDIFTMNLIGLNPERAEHVFIAGREYHLGEIALENMIIDNQINRVLPKAKEAKNDWAIKTMNMLSHSDFLTRHLILDDKIFYPIRSVVQKIRAVAGQ
jgi:uncharacterized protein (DUF362 family)